MRAKELWRFAPRMQMKTEPKRAMAAPTDLAPPELQAKMVAAFERARAERLAALIPEKAAPWGGDPWTRANMAAFLILERERRVVAARLSRPYRRRADRYRDLILVTKLIHVQYEHLAGRIGAKPSSASRSSGLLVSGDRPADWARPWGSGPMVEMGTALSFYEDQRDRLARRLPATSLGSAAAAAAGQRDRILNRFERAKREFRAEHEALSEGDPESGTLPLMAQIAGQNRSAGKAWPWASLRFTRRAAAVAAVYAAVGVGAILAETRSGEPLDVVNAPSRAVAGVPEALAAVGERPRELRPARGEDDGSQAPKPDQGKADQAALTAVEIPPAAPEPVPEPPPATIAPATTVVAPAPPAPEPQPDSNPQPDPNPGPGPVSSLPPPVGNLPPPGGSGKGGS